MSARAQEVPPRPNVLPPNIDGIPSGLTELPRFMGWKNELKDGRWTKVPKKAGGGLAKSQDPKTWTDFQSIEAAYNERIGVFDGIGIALGQCGDCYLVGIDVDSC